MVLEIGPEELAHVRISVGTADQNERCLANLRAYLASRG